MRDSDLFKSEIQPTPKVRQIYTKPKGVYFNNYELKYVKIGLKTYMSTYTNNLNQKVKRGTNPEDSTNYDDLILVMKIYKKITGHYYFNEKLYKLLEIEKGEDLEK